MKQYLVALGPGGKRLKCTLITTEQAVERGGLSFLVDAKSEEQAYRKAANLYARRIVTMRRRQYAAEGKCRCGRERDDKAFRTCSVCRERTAVYQQKSKAHKAANTFEPRNEKARVAANLHRQRDRRAEIRAEVLIEVRRYHDKHPKSFRLWPEREISKTLQPKVRAA